MTFGYQKDLVRNWFDRAQARDVNTFDRFIYTWIALNAALSARYPISRDKQKVRDLAADLASHWDQWLDLDGELREAVTDLAQQSPIHRSQEESAVLNR
jgi:hypothetical protein